MNGIEVAVKFPKTKLALNPRGLKMFEQEIALQAKVSANYFFIRHSLSISVFFMACAGAAPPLRADHGSGPAPL